MVPLAFAVIGLAVAAVLARRGDWLGATAVTGATGLLVSPISWAHHWVWILPALVLLIRGGHRIAAVAGYLLFAVAPFWFTPHAAGPREYGFHWLTTLVANCFLLAGLAFLGYMALTQLGRPQRAGDQAEDLRPRRRDAGPVRGRPGRPRATQRRRPRRRRSRRRDPSPRARVQSCWLAVLWPVKTTSGVPFFFEKAGSSRHSVPWWRLEHVHSRVRE